MPASDNSTTSARRTSALPARDASIPFLLGLDYELFLGRTTGSAQRCLIEPTRQIAEIAERHAARLTLFVDAAYVARLRALAPRHAGLQRDLRNVGEQLRSLVARGHDVQLHVHPQWENGTYDGEKWILPDRPYRLQDFPEAELNERLSAYKSCLEDVAGVETFAFRAGGWCIQPFRPMRTALARNGLWLDSTVFAGGHSDEAGREFDFRGAPALDHWRFDEDPLRADPDGPFVEVPIGAIALSPSLFWRMSLLPRLNPGMHRTLGDGSAMASSIGYYATRLLLPSRSTVTVDGLKAGTLPAADAHARRRRGWLNVMGHPKALTPYSLRALDAYLAGAPPLEPMTFRALEFLKPA
jgi:hypothetical protein